MVEIIKYFVMKKEEDDIVVKNKKLGIVLSNEKYEVMKYKFDLLCLDRRNLILSNYGCSFS